MACRGSGVRVPVAPPDTRRPPTFTPRRRRGVTRIPEPREDRDRHRQPTRRPAAAASSATTPRPSSRAGRRAGPSSACTRRTSRTRRKPKYYLLTMYPYPSGDLHIGHWYIVTPDRRAARAIRRMHGYNVFFPIGFDAFGLPAENAAIKSGSHPFNWTMHEHREHAPPVPDDGRDVRLGRTRSSPPTRSTTAGTSGSSCSFLEARPGLPRRSRRSTGAPTTGRWRASRSRAPTATAGAAARRSRSATWSSGSCARRTTPTSCCDFDGIDWPEPIRIQQTNWIGRSEGAEIDFTTAPTTTSPAARRCASSPPGRTRCSARRSWCWRRSTRWSPTLTAPERRAEVEAYVEQARRRTEIDRLSTDREKTGVAIGADADQPGQRRAHPDLHRRLRAGRLRHRRDHGRARPRRARLRVRARSSACRSGASWRRPARDADDADGRTPTSPTPPTSGWSTAAAFDGLPADEGGKAIVAQLAETRRRPSPRSPTACATG